MKKYEIIAGLLSGLFTIALFIIAYAIDPRLMLHPGLYWGSLIIYLFGMLGACLLGKRRGEGVLGFRNAVRTAFVTFLLANCLYLAFYFIMFNVVDPGLPEIQKELFREFYEVKFKGKALKDQLTQLDAENFQLDASTIIFGFGRGAIGGFILSLLLALAVRQEA